MKGLCRLALAALFVAACGGNDAITNPEAPNATPLPPGVLAIGTDPTTGASIETNKDDYTPGEVVHVVGHGWAAGETVNLHMTENPDTHADVDMNVTADATGSFSIHYYDVQTHDIGVTFTLTATGATSHSLAVATFWDNVPVGTFTVNGGATTTVAPLASVAAVVTGNVNNGGVSNTLGSIGVRSYIDGSLPSTSTLLKCEDVADITYESGAAIPYSASFNFTAPAGTGTYDIFAASYASDDCSGSSIGTKTLDNGLIVQQASNAAPTVSAGADKSVAEGTPISLGGGAPNGASASDPDGDALTYSWTTDKTAMDAGADCVFGPGTSTDLGPTITCDDDSNAGTVKLTLTVDDGHGHTASDFLLLTVTNANPAADAHGDYTGTEGGSVSLTGSSTDAGSHDTHTYKWTYAAGAGVDANATCSFSDDTNLSPTVSCTDDGTFTLTLTVTDDDLGSDSDDATLTLGNANPVADAHGDYTGTEGGTVTLTGSKTDAGSNDTHTYKWTYAAGAGVDVNATCSFSNDAILSPTVSCTDDGTFTLTLTVTDDDLGSDSDDATLTLGNATPNVTITSPAAYSIMPIGTINVTATYTDAGANDTHDCEIFLDGVIDVTNAYSAVSSGSCAKPIVPVEAGVYTLTVRIKDDDGAVGTATINVVVYDPSAGFVTGGGWINSPANAYRDDLSLIGKANFGFVSKYKRGATVPEGNTEFQFQAGGLNFHSSTYQWLVVNQLGTNAQFKGTGTINGTGSYTFMLWATDGGNSADKFRIQITDNNNNDAVVYDNGVDQLIAGGSIVIQTGGKK